MSALSRALRWTLPPCLCSAEFLNLCFQTRRFLLLAAVLASALINGVTLGSSLTAVLNMGFKLSGGDQSVSSEWDYNQARL